jgi:hypothetical protein
VGVFSAWSFVEALRGVASSDFPWNQVWRVKVPLKVAFFMWTVGWGNILTLDDLSKRGMVLVNWCVMCKCSIKTLDHLLLHCLMAVESWNFIFVALGVKWVMPKTV